jgi:hypothetical protein
VSQSQTSSSLLWPLLLKNPPFSVQFVKISTLRALGEQVCTCFPRALPRALGNQVGITCLPRALGKQVFTCLPRALCQP